MEVSQVIKALLEIKVEYPSMSHDEILQVMLIKTLMEIRGKL